MFDVSAWLLYDAHLGYNVLLQSRLVFNCCFEYTAISQGSVATHLRCGGIISDTIIKNILVIRTVK